MGKKLYVGNLSYQVDSSELEQLFGAHGTVVSAQIINDRDTGRSKGFGFVEMGSDEEAQAAVAAAVVAADSVAAAVVAAVDSAEAAAEVAAVTVAVAVVEAANAADAIAT